MFDRAAAVVRVYRRCSPKSVYHTVFVFWNDAPRIFSLQTFELSHSTMPGCKHVGGCTEGDWAVGVV